MNSFVILAAGRGTRVGRAGEKLHKALLPLGDRAMLSHVIRSAEPDEQIVICIGDRGAQIQDYVSLAHRGRDITFIHVDGWDQPGAGPGASLLAAREFVGDGALTYTSCDTLIAHSDVVPSTSWAAVAPVPAGTAPDRWCRLVCDETNLVVSMLDKRVGGTHWQRQHDFAYVGFAHIIKEDLQEFWKGIESGELRHGERRDPDGFMPLIDSRRLHAVRVEWTDVGDESSYRRAVADHTGYDWTKIDQATYVLPDEGRVVKYMADPTLLDERSTRGFVLGDSVPKLIEVRPSMLAYEFVPGETMYRHLEVCARPLQRVKELLNWRDKHYTDAPRHVSMTEAREVARSFYEDKTRDRIATLESRELRLQALDAVMRIHWRELFDRIQPAIIHGDLNFGNVIVRPNGTFVGIDWRENFSGAGWFDARYDLAKLLSGTVIHWDNARRGDFRPWDEGEFAAGIIRSHAGDDLRSVEIIGALTLLNSAPLHASPLDEILVARGTSWLERVL